MSEEKILTLHPEGKKGVNIVKHKYDVLKNFIIATVEEYQPITYQDVNDLAILKLKDSFEGSIQWYLVTVKLDLEARGIIERIPKTSPHQLRIKEGG